MFKKYIHVTLNCSSPFTIAFLGEFASWCWNPEGDYHARQLTEMMGRWGNNYSPWNHSQNLLDTCWKAHHREEEPIRVEVLKHPLHRLPVDAERDAGCPQVQATAYHVVRLQEVLVDGGHGSGYATWWAKNRRKACRIRGKHSQATHGGGRDRGLDRLHFKWGDQWETAS